MKNTYTSINYQSFYYTYIHIHIPYLSPSHPHSPINPPTHQINRQNVTPTISHPSSHRHHPPHIYNLERKHTARVYFYLRKYTCKCCSFFLSRFYIHLIRARELWARKALKFRRVYIYIPILSLRERAYTYIQVTLYAHARASECLPIRRESRLTYSISILIRTHIIGDRVSRDEEKKSGKCCGDWENGR